MNLYCFPFAGGNAYSYRGLGESLGRVVVTTFELPGRGRRFREPSLHDLDAMVEDLYRQVRPGLRRPYAFYGHSLGASLAYLLTRRTIAEGDLPPRYLFVSGQKGPAVGKDETRHLLPKEAFRDMLIDLGGCPPEILAEPELFDLFEPVLRADIAALATRRYEAADPLDVPIQVMTGRGDDVSEQDAMQWQRETTREIRLAQFPGGHFFIHQHWSEIRRLMSWCLASIEVLRETNRWATSC